jgi:xanthine dehydrogenase accessory factor
MIIVVTIGATDNADGVASRLGGIGSERFVYSHKPGLWHASVDIGARVFRQFVVGHLDGVAVRAPFDGVVRGIARDGLQIPADVKLLEIDPRGRGARWTGIDDRGRCIAHATMRAIRMRTERHMRDALAIMSTATEGGR